MKRKTFYKSALVFALSYFSFGCSKIADINESPNNPSVDVATPQVLLPSAEISAAGRIGGELNILGGIWSQYWTQSISASQYKSIDTYNLIRTDLNANYDNLFAGTLADLQLAIGQSKTSGQSAFYLMCTLMKAYVYETLVDLYDQVPYTEAFQGAANIQPKFDDGYSIYKGLLAEIDAAVTASAGAGALSDAEKKTDFVFNGDLAKWRQFANTLKLKMYLRMINAKPAEAQAGVQKLLQTGNFLTSDAGISIYSDATNKRNPFYTYNIFALNVTTNLRASKTLVSYMSANADPRLQVYFGSANPTPQDQGNVNASQTAFPSYPTSATPVQHATDPVFFITAAESYFLQAEAAVRYGNAADAEALYNSGIRASFVQNQLSGTTPAGYTFPKNGGTEEKIEAIITQKWLSLPSTCHTLEGFFDQERTGYPRFSSVYSTQAGYVPGQWVISPSSVLPSGKYPKRLVFPDSERSRNNNTPVEVPITTPVWWGK